MSSPGFGLGGGLAVTCLALILLSSFAIKAVNWIEVIIFCTGLLLLILEFFVLPTFGVAGILGFVFTIVGLFLLMLPHMENVHFTNGHFSSEQVSFAMNEILKRLAWFCGAIVLSVLAISFLGRFLAKRKFFYKRLISSGEQEASLGYVAGRTKEELPKIHARGVTVSTMRPSGKIEIEGKTYDAFSEGGFIDGNTPIFVYRIEGNKIIVRAFEEK
jgi:membrane-bound ClpP family serine protease